MEILFAQEMRFEGVDDVHRRSRWVAATKVSDVPGMYFCYLVIRRLGKDSPFVHSTQGRTDQKRSKNSP